MILIFKLDLNCDQNVAPHKNEVSMSRHSKVFVQTDRQTDKHTHTHTHTHTNT